MQKATSLCSSVKSGLLCPLTLEACAWCEFEQCVISLSLSFFLYLFPTDGDLFSFQERANVDSQREALERLQDGYNELKSQLHNCPESLREQLQEQLKRVSLILPGLIQYQDHPKLCTASNIEHTTSNHSISEATHTQTTSRSTLIQQMVDIGVHDVVMYNKRSATL